jgi:tetratricopeptide (TPR) repeat protein
MIFQSNILAMSRRTTTAVFGLVLTVLMGASPARASCDKDAIAKLMFVLANIHSAASETDSDWIHKLDEAGEHFCPRTFIVRAGPASNDTRAYRSIKFDVSFSGTAYDENATLWINKTLRPALKGEGYEQVGDTPEWRGPSSTFVTLRAVNEPGKVLCAIRVETYPPSTAAEYLDRGNMYFNKRDFDSTIRDYTEAIRLRPNYPAAFTNRGAAYDATGNHDRAIQDFTDAIRLKPDLGEAFFYRGIAYKNKGDYEHARQDFKHAAELNPQAVEQVNKELQAMEK